MGIMPREAKASLDVEKVVKNVKDELNQLLRFYGYGNLLYGMKVWGELDMPRSLYSQNGAGPCTEASSSSCGPSQPQQVGCSKTQLRYDNLHVENLARTYEDQGYR